MAKNLVIVESPAKAKTIGKILGADFSVMSSMGHVMDLPLKKLGVDIKNGFKPELVVVKGRKELVDGLKRAAVACESVYLAPDPDREGEAIAWHLQSLLKKAAKKATFHRVSYNEITPKAVREAFDHPTQVDMKRVYAQQARRILDRIVGYKVSPLLWTRVRSGSSAGRVQSVALRLICEREMQIIGFVPQEYWLLTAEVRKLVDPKDPFVVRLAQVDGKKADVKSKEEADRILADLEGRPLNVSKLSTREVSRKAPPPFITSSMQQAMSSRFGMAAAVTMRVAQKLYEGVDIGGETIGLITYMRTDSFSVSKDALGACREYIAKDFGHQYVPETPNLYRSRSGAQEAHEAIRPTDVNRTPASVGNILSPAELKVYRSIWERFVGSQMKPAVMKQTTAEVVAVPPAGRLTTYMFRASSSEVVFAGYMQATGFQDIKVEEKNEKEEAEELQQRLPPLSEGEPLERLKWLSDRKETQPPARFSEGSLVRELELNGVGRPSTYAQIISTLNYRRYVTREKRSLVPTKLGMDVNAFLVGHLSELFDVQFTARMEEDLDKVEEGHNDWTKMIEDFYGKFVQWLEKAKGPPADAGKVQAALDILGQVRNWAPEVKHGRRTYSDEKFVGSIHDQIKKAERAVSERQLLALAKIACRYEENVPGMRQMVVNAGLMDAATAAIEDKPDEKTLRKLDLLSKVQCDEPSQQGKKVFNDRKFMDSLVRRTTEGRDLSPAQKQQVDRLVLKYSSQIEGFEAMKGELGLDMPPVQEDQESAELLTLMTHVTKWRPESKRGTRVFSDKSFCESLKTQFERKRVLSPKQKIVLKKIVAAYHGQIPGFDEMASKYALKIPGKRAAHESAEDGHAGKAPLAAAGE